jgi:hypothetical protein
MIKAFNTLAAANGGAGVQDLVLDLRYNGGGLIGIAGEIGYMIAGPASTSGQTFYLPKFNAKHPTINPVVGTPITPLPFPSTAVGYSAAGGTPLPTLNLNRVFVLTGHDTCSAAEAVINGLRGVNVEVIEIGSTTCGKPYGFYPQDDCGTTYFSIEFQGYNAMGFGDFGDGFSPDNAVGSVGVRIEGCSIADDFTHDLGDPAEGRLAVALAYQSGTPCPPATGMTALEEGQPSTAQTVSDAAALIRRPFWRELLILH